MRMSFSKCCLLVCIAAGCNQSQPQNSSSKLSDQVEVLTNRIENLESRPLNSSSNNSGQVQVDRATAAGVFANATHVAEAGHNVLIYFATRNHASDKPRESTARLTVYMNHYTIKRLEAALAMSVQRHVSTFGNVKPDESIGQPNVHDKTETTYANFVRLTGTPEELIIELALNPKPYGVSTDPIPIGCTVIMDFHTATTFLQQLSDLIANYEAKNGPIETDIQKRIAN